MRVLLAVYTVGVLVIAGGLIRYRWLELGRVTFPLVVGSVLAAALWPALTLGWIVRDMRASIIYLYRRPKK